MVWIKDIWFYFLQSEETAYVDIYSGNVYHEPADDALEIPKPFTKLMLLRDYTGTFADSVKYGGEKLSRFFADINDDEKLRQEFHSRMYSSSDCENEYWDFFPYAKARLFEYAEKWCIENGLQYNRKDAGTTDGFTYLSI